jgi:quinol monooxygenase YgiN
MPIRSTRTLTRPNTVVSFFKSSDAWKTYLKDTYQETGLQLSVNVSHSNGGTVSTVTAVWKDQAAYNAYMNDPKVQQMFLTPRAAHAAANDIVITDFQVELI